MKIINNIYLKYLILITLVCFPIFQHLGDTIIELWDEGRLSINALEMIINKNFIVTTFNNLPDIWNTKPPFLIWCQALSMHIFGWNEIALRLPTSFAILFLCTLLYYFLVNKIHSKWLASFALIILITCNGFMLHHTGRSANYDGMLCLFLFASFVFFYLIIDSNKTKYYYLFFGAIVLAMLTKSIAGLFLIPAFIIYAIYQNKLLILLKNKHFYFGILGFITIILSYYLFREHLNPGYINASIENEITGRYFNVNEGHDEGFWYYFYRLKNDDLFCIWFWSIPIGICIGLFNTNKTIKDISFFTTICLFTLFLIISISKTKLEWYSMPLFPFIAIIVSIVIYIIFIALMQLKKIPFTFNFLPYLFAFIIFTLPYLQMTIQTNSPLTYNINNDVNNEINVLKDAIKYNKNINNYTLVSNEGHTSNFMYYVYILKYKKGITVNIKQSKDLAKNETIIVSDEEIKNEISKKFHLEVVNHINKLDIYKLQ